ncbi:MAG: GNAT family N-acetyltransferase [Planctomycetota bacterium]|nr:GNAT family N-acetyltransferase [Planctomycetota bacterium]
MWGPPRSRRRRAATCTFSPWALSARTNGRPWWARRSRFRPRSTPWMARLAGREAWRLFGAFDGETLAAAAALYMHGEIGELTWAGTREGWRGRGAQSALIAARFAAAREAGVKWLVTETDEELPDKPNPSYHNMVRLGLPVRYVRANWGPPKPADA